MNKNNQEFNATAYGHEWKIRGIETNDAGILSEVFSDKTYDLNYIKHDIKTIVDVGAHIGGFTVKAMQKFNDAKCYSFEPMIGSYELLKKNVGVFGSRVETFNKTISGDRLPVKLEKTMLKFSSGQVNTGSNIFKYEKCDNTYIDNIHIKELQEHIPYIDLLKLDCEGGENSIFENLDFSRVKYIYCELHTYGSLIGNNATLDLLERNGFILLRHNFINDTINDFIAVRG